MRLAKLVLSASTLAACAAFAACAGAGPEEADCYWIGSINSLTGSLAPLGAGMENAAKLAVEDINRAGLIGGKKLCITTGDDRGKPERARAIVEAMIAKSNVRAINGAVASSATLMAAKAAEAHQMTIISGSSSSPEKSKDPLIYRTLPSDSLQGVALASVVHDRGVRTVSVIYVDNSYGRSLADVFKTAFEDGGGHVSISTPYKDSQASYVDVLQTALAEPLPEAVLLVAYPVDGAQIIRDWARSHIAPGVRWFGSEAVKDDTFVSLVGSAIPLFEGTAPAPSSPHYQSFVQRYKAAYGGEYPSTFASYNYDAVILIALSMAKIGPDPQPEMIRAALPAISRGPGVPIHADDLIAAIQYVESGVNVNYGGVSGPVDLDEHGDVLGGYRVWTIQPGAASITDSDVCFSCAPNQMRSSGVECRPEACDGVNP